MRARREHPATIAGRYYLLLLLPLIRGVPYIRLPNGFPRWWEGIWLDGATLLLVFAISVAAWRRRSYDLTPDRLRRCRGLVWRRTTLIPLRGVTTLTVERPLWMRLLKAARVSADTDGGSHRSADVQMTLWRPQAALFLPESEGGVYLDTRAWRIWLLSLLSSDSLGGLLLLTAALRQSSELLGESIRHRVMDNLETVAETVRIIPRTAALLVLIIAISWCVGTARHLLRHLPFVRCRRQDTLTIYMGRLTRRIHCCAVEAIHYADIRQTLVAYLLNIYTVYISCTGYGKDKRTLAVVIPPCGKRRLAVEWEALLPHLPTAAVTARPAKGAPWRALRPPLFFLLLSPLLGQVVGRVQPLWWEVATYLSLMALLPCLWWGAVRVAALRVTGLGYAEGCYHLCYTHRLSLHRVTLPTDKVAAVSLRQSPSQRRHGTCDVCLYSHHEFCRPHRVRHLKYNEVQELLKEV